MKAPPLLFDLDGTLIDSLPDIHASANHLRATFDLAPVSLEVARRYVGDGVGALMARSLAELGDFEPHRERAWRTYREHHLEQCTRLVQPYPGVRTLLARWHAAGHPMAVVTNKSSPFVDRILEHLELVRYLPVRVCGDTIEHRKPHPAPVHEALRRLGVSTAIGTMIGDSVQDLRAGKAAGMRTIGVLFGIGDAAALRDEGADEFWVEFGVTE